jgi:hypothetical protein
MGGPSKKALGDDVMGARCNNCPGEHLTGDPGGGTRAYARPAIFLRRLLLLFALICSAIGSPQALAAKAVTKGNYGAIALERDSGQLGYTSDALTSRAAKTEALRLCAHPRCEVVTSFRNACGVLARGPKKYVPATGATRQEAEAKALRLCAARECEILAWACTK